MILRPATETDVAKFRGAWYPASMRGIVAEHDGEIYGITGVLHTSPLQAFAEMRDDMSRFPRYIVMAIRQFEEILENYHAPVYAKASTKYPNAVRVLLTAGFEPIEHDKRLFRWIPRH